METEDVDKVEDKNETSGSGMIDFVPTDGCGFAATVHTAALQKVEMFYDSFSSDMNDLLDDHIKFVDKKTLLEKTLDDVRIMTEEEFEKFTHMIDTEHDRRKHAWVLQFRIGQSVRFTKCLGIQRTGIVKKRNKGGCPTYRSISVAPTGGVKKNIILTLGDHVK